MCCSRSFPPLSPQTIYFSLLPREISALFNKLIFGYGKKSTSRTRLLGVQWPRRPWLQLQNKAASVRPPLWQQSGSNSLDKTGGSNLQAGPQCLHCQQPNCGFHHTHRSALEYHGNQTGKQASKAKGNGSMANSSEGSTQKLDPLPFQVHHGDSPICPSNIMSKEGDLHDFSL